MKHCKMKPLTPGLLVALGIVACSGGGGSDIAGIGGTGMVAVGQITGFGSVFVNGKEYFQESGGTLVVNGNPADENALKIGMMVTLRGSIDSTGRATYGSLVYDAEIKGPITDLMMGTDMQTATLSIMGKTVIVDAVGTAFDDNYSFTMMTQNDFVEVSGYVSSNDGSIQATRIEYHGSFTADDTVEIKGRLTEFLSTNQFRLDGSVIVNFGNTTIFNLNSGGFNTGRTLVITGQYDRGSAVITASRIDAAGNSLPDSSDEAEIEGIISGYDFNGDTEFEVNGIPVDAGNTGLEPTSLVLDNGLTVEVEGRLSGGTLLADKIKAREENIEIGAYVSTAVLTNNTVRLQITPTATLDVIIDDDKTRMEDETGVVANTPSDPMRLDDIRANDFLEIRAVHSSDGRLVATIVKRKTRDNEIILQGPLDDTPTLTGQVLTLRILGVTFTSDAATNFEVDDGSDNDSNAGDAAAFQALLSSPGRIVKVTDEIQTGITGDGVAEEMEVEN